MEEEYVQAAGKVLGVISPPHIEIHCERDGGSRRFDSKGKIYLQKPREFRFITYRCRDCRITEKTIAVVIERKDLADVEVMKLGEYPPFSTPIPPLIQKRLETTSLEVYRKGVRATAQGLGIGAASYFRRIVESQWSLFVEEIRNAAKRLGVKDLHVYDDALKTTQFKTAVEILEDAIPDKLLLLDGRNPLKLLHRALSQQLHVLTDDQCLEMATDIRVVLDAFLENIASVLKDEGELRAAADRLNKTKVPAGDLTVPDCAT